MGCILGKENKIKNYIVSGDQHLAINKHSPTEWQVNRYEELFDTYLKLCNENKASLILSGDWFHKAEPELEEIQLTMQFFRRCKTEGIEVFIIAGNHCSMATGKNTLDFLDMGSDKTIAVHYKTHGWYHEVPEEKATFWFLSHCNLAAPNWETPEVKPEGLNILISHFRCSLGYHIKEEIDVAGLVQSFDLAVCSDIHLPHEDGNLIYTAQPINSEFQNKPNTGVILLSIESGKYNLKRIATSLPALIQRNCNCVEFATLELNDRDFYRVEVTGTLPELRLLTAPANMKLVKQPLVDMVLTEIEEEAKELVETSLDVDLVGYMGSLKYSDDKVSRMMEVWNEV